MKARTIVLSILMAMCLGMNAQAREPSQISPGKNTGGIFDLPPFERAVCCIKYYEGIHRKKDYPYVGYGHKLKKGETYSWNMSFKEAEALLRKDLKSLCEMFSQYGKDSLLLAALAYNVGPYKVLGCKGRWPKSKLLKKIEAGMRDFKEDYVEFCRWKGKKVPSIERRRYAELALLYAE
jgi:lysozyme